MFSKKYLLPFQACSTCFFVRGRPYWITLRTNKAREDKMTDKQKSPQLIPPHGGYRELQSFQMAEIVYDGTVIFCDCFINMCSHTHDQMVQAARSGKQNHSYGVTEGCMASGTCSVRL